MRRFLCLLSVLTTVVIAAPRAEASSFTLSSFTVDYNDSTPGLALWETALVPGLDFSLNNVGDTYSAALFDIGTDDSRLNLTDLIPRPISVDFTFTNPAPTFGGTTDGITGALSWGGSFGYVMWDNPLVLKFGNSGLLGITLSDSTFGMPGSTTISGNFRLLRVDTVPEPATLLLLCTGFAAVGGRRCFKRKSA